MTSSTIETSGEFGQEGQLPRDTLSYIGVYGLSPDMIAPSLAQQPPSTWPIQPPLPNNASISSALTPSADRFAGSEASSLALSHEICIVQPPSRPFMPIQVVQYDHERQQKMRMKGPGQPMKRKKSHVKPSRKEKFMADMTPKFDIKRASNGTVAGAEGVFRLEDFVRVSTSIEERLATCNTRQKGACEKCQKSRLRCDRPSDIYDLCPRCKKALHSAILNQKWDPLIQPCFQVSILDLQLHRKGPTLFDDLQIWVEKKHTLLQYQDHAETHSIFITQGYEVGLENPLCLTVSRFEVQPGDRTSYYWTNSSGRLRDMEMPPFYISDLESARQSFRGFLRDSRSAYLDSFLADSNPIVCQTFQLSMFHAADGKSSLISTALDIWVASRYIENHWRIFCGFAKLGLEPVNEPGHPYDGFIPVTPIMDTQIDDLVIRHLIQPLSKQFLKLLEAKITEQRRENRLEIYLAVFIMLSNVGWIIKDLVERTTSKGLKKGCRGGTLTQGYIHACKTMLSYFHNSSAKFITPNIRLPALGSKDNQQKYKTCPNERRDYFTWLSDEIARQGSTPSDSKLSNWRSISMYDDDTYWCYQIFDRDWKGDIPHAGPIDDFREEDFLSSSKE